MARSRVLHRFILVTIGATLLLVGWGGFVTSINAGLAVPDWPTSFYSWDPLSPFPGWWMHTPVLAEHGHRLLGALVGLLTLVLAGWTWRVDTRLGVKALGVMALVVVILQGILGGLRVVLVSLDLAVVHALTAQLFLGILVTLAVMTSAGWLALPDRVELSDDRHRLARWAMITTAAIFVQIGFGALLRHPGAGIDVSLAIIHIVGATVVFIVTFLLIRIGLSGHRDDQRLRGGLLAIMVVLTLQVVLGITAYFVLLNQSGMLIPSNLQVTINSLHVVVGAVLWGTAVAIAVWAHAMPANHDQYAD
ncbi:MAG: heme A synthase, partial [Rhodothermia bacterium]